MPDPTPQPDYVAEMNKHYAVSNKAAQLVDDLSNNRNIAQTRAGLEFLIRERANNNRDPNFITPNTGNHVLQAGGEAIAKARADAGYNVFNTHSNDVLAQVDGQHRPKVKDNYLKIEPKEIDGDDAHNKIVKTHKRYNSLRGALEQLATGDESILPTVREEVVKLERQNTINHMSKTDGVEYDPQRGDPYGFGDLVAAIYRTYGSKEVLASAGSILQNTEKAIGEMLPADKDKEDYGLKNLRTLASGNDTDKRKASQYVYVITK